jgi:hypothetical protein
MSLRGAAKKRTVCEVLREINDIISFKQNIPQDVIIAIRVRLIEAERMTKKMSIKLRVYNQRYDANWWKQNKDYEKDIKRREKLSIKG